MKTINVPSTFEQYMAEHKIPADHPNLDDWREVYAHQVIVEQNAPAVPPCPSWCTSPDGHDYDCVDGGEVADLTYFRNHVVMQRPHLLVDATEHNRNGVVTMDAASICVASNRDDLDAEQARAFAAELLEAADLLDRVNGATRTCPRSTAHEPHSWASMVPGEDWSCPGVTR
jgi:hypothetical protein